LPMDNRAAGRNPEGANDPGMAEAIPRARIPAAPLHTPDGLFDNPQLNAVGFFETVDTAHGPVRFSGVPTWFPVRQVESPAPPRSSAPTRQRCSKNSD